MKTLHIENKTIGAGRPTFVIAEIGVNHDGCVDKALQLVEIAAQCGADAVKLQLFEATQLMHSSCLLAEYQKDRVEEASAIDMLKRYELTQEEFARVVRAIRRHEMIPLATPFSPTDLVSVARLQLPAIKIASPDLVNRPLLSAAATMDRPLLLSTGAASIDEVDRTSRWLESWGAGYAFMHCISSYPVQSEQANLSWIPELAERFSAPIGYSDHTTDMLCGAFAASAGATIIEKHLTYDNTAQGPDHSASADPAQFREYVSLIRRADVLYGAAGKRVLDCERDVRSVSRQSLVLRRDLVEGEVLSEADLTVQRPGTGLSASLITSAIGRKVLRPLRAGVMLQWDMLSGAA